MRPDVFWLAPVMMLASCRSDRPPSSAPDAPVLELAPLQLPDAAPPPPPPWEGFETFERIVRTKCVEATRTDDAEVAFLRDDLVLGYHDFRCNVFGFSDFLEIDLERTGAKDRVGPVRITRLEFISLLDDDEYHMECSGLVADARSVLDEITGVEAIEPMHRLEHETHRDIAIEWEGLRIAVTNDALRNGGHLCRLRIEPVDVAQRRKQP
jgi:hypothetical protein